MVYLSFYLARRKGEVHTFKLPFRLPLLLLLWFGVIQVFNPASTSIFYGILGMKLYFYYIPLIFIGYALINKESDLQKFFPYLLGLSFVVALLGIAQSILGHTFLNPTIIADDIRDLSTNYRTSPISGVVVYRPTSVFVSAGRFAFFLSLSGCLPLGMVSISFYAPARAAFLLYSASGSSPPRSSWPLPAVRSCGRGKRHCLRHCLLMGLPVAAWTACPHPALLSACPPYWAFLRGHCHLPLPNRGLKSFQVLLGDSLPEQSR